VATKWSRFPRSSVRNGFTRPTGQINVNSPPYTQRPSSKKNLNENLLWLATFPAGDQPTRKLPQAFPWVRPSYAPFTFPQCKQRSTLFEVSEPHTIKRPRKGKTSIRKFVFFGKFAKPRGSHSGGIGSSPSSACRSKTCSMPWYHEPGNVAVLGCFPSALTISMSFLSPLRAVMSARLKQHAALTIQTTPEVAQKVIDAIDALRSERSED
jgi:hypothetical protein